MGEFIVMPIYHLNSFNELKPLNETVVINIDAISHIKGINYNIYEPKDIVEGWWIFKSTKTVLLPKRQGAAFRVCMVDGQVYYTIENPVVVAEARMRKRG